MSAARPLRVRAGLAHALVETRAHTAGTRSHWTITLVQLDALGAHPVQSWTGEGPLGRLRAHRDAIEHCQRQHIDARIVSEGTAPPTHKRNRAWEWAQCLGRLRDEGVI